MLYVEITYPDGSTARWAFDPDNSVDDAQVLINLEDLLGTPDTQLL